MRVNIGPYPNNHWSTSRLEIRWYQWRYNKFYLSVDEHDGWDRAFEGFCSAWQWVLNHTVNPLVRNRERRIEVRIDPHDTWSMDTTLGHIILPMLRQLKATKHGSPWVEDEDAPPFKKRKKRKSADEHDDIHERWNWVLDEMIWAFEQVIAADDGMSNYYVPYGPDEELERGYFENAATGEKKYLLTEEETRKMGRYDRDLHKAYQDRVNRGLAFFGKYYQNLWD